MCQKQWQVVRDTTLTIFAECFLCSMNVLETAHALTPVTVTASYEVGTTLFPILPMRNLEQMAQVHTDNKGSNQKFFGR